MIEEMAYRDEKYLRASNQNGDVLKNLAVNDLYLEAISTKLKILDHM